ncbi:MAG: SAM-dependent methyltransferase [Coriobacteriia bacterium]|nr:MAG: SAM-dependent methyltransferase [Coriobacteriia bacterium]
MDASSVNELKRAGLELRRDADGLILEGDGMRLRASFDDMKRRLLHGKLNGELLVRAARLKGIEEPTLVDATAGLGQDSLLLAAAGFSVTLIECNPVIAAMLVDAIERARRDPELADAAGRMRVIEGNSLKVLRDLSMPPDVVYLDPMFPGRSKSAAVKKKFQLLHRLEMPCEDEMALLEAARAAHPRKIVIKRPVKGPHLAGVKPDYTLRGKAVRYDCIVMARES